jgi:transposase InsO family protein
MCQLFGVSKSGYYDWLNGKSYEPSEEKSRKKELVSQVFGTHKRRYGSRRIEAELKKQGEQIGRFQVRSLMKCEKLVAIQPKSFVPKTTKDNPSLARSPNLLLESGSVDRPNQVWVGDITYLPKSNGGWYYLSTWQDMFTCEIVGSKVSETLEADFVVESLQKAIEKSSTAAGMIIHSDGGGQYKSIEFRQLLKSRGFRQSMTRKDNHYDNAKAESLFSRLKAEMLCDQKFKTLEEAELMVFEYVEYYNNVRLHSSLGYKTPREFYQHYEDEGNNPTE